jgi:TfoX/Sxy family transcriptional regulator of competence genes
MTAERVRDDLLERFGDEGIVAARMFGSFAIMLDGKVLATFHSTDAVFKVGRDSELLVEGLESGLHLFDPSGKNRAMKDWLVVDDGRQLDPYLLQAIALQRA